MKKSEKQYLIADFCIARGQHSAICLGAFGIAIFEVNDLAFLEALQVRRASTVTTTMLVELYSDTANKTGDDTRHIGHLLAARERMTIAGLLVERAS
jgi:hypothetical protein